MEKLPLAVTKALSNLFFHTAKNNLAEEELELTYKSPSPPQKPLTRPGVDAERMAWQDDLLRGELWLLEGHLKKNCVGCGGDVECCFKHSQNIIDAARETQSMTTDPLYQEAVRLAERLKPYVHPDDVKTAKYKSQYPTFVLEVSQLRTKFDAKLMKQPPSKLGKAPHYPIIAHDPFSPAAVRFVPPPSKWLTPERPPRFKPGLPPGRKYELIEPEEEKRIHEVYTQLKESHPEWGVTTLAKITGEQMKRSLSAIWRTINRGLKHKYRAVNPQKIAQVLALRCWGMTLERIGKEVGLSKGQVRVILRRGGQRIDWGETTEELMNAIYRVSEELRRPDTLFQLTAAADRVREVGEDAAVLLETIKETVKPEIMPLEVPWAIHANLGSVHSRSLLAEEALRNAVWCLQEKPKFEGTARGERLRECGERAREVARWVIEEHPGYETEATVVMWETEEMMQEET